MSRALVSLLLVTAVYLLALASTDPLDALVGGVLAAALLLALRRFLFPGRAAPFASLPRRALAFLPFAAAVLWDITKGTWDVALVVLHVRPLVVPGVVAIPIGERTEAGLAAMSLVATLSPGEFLVDVDHESGVVLIHVLDASDPDAVRERHEDFYRRYQKAVFP
jgi:multicomponent Na+:H+ antiporter subunit E